MKVRAMLLSLGFGLALTGFAPAALAQFAPPSMPPPPQPGSPIAPSIPSGGPSGPCGIDVKMVVELFESSYDANKPECDVTLEGKSCNPLNKGEEICRVGTSLMEQIFGKMKDAVKGILKGKFPKLNDAYCGVVDLAFGMWKDRRTVNGILYPGGYCIECSGAGSSMNANDTKFVVFSINTCSGKQWSGDHKPPCPKPPMCEGTAAYPRVYWDDTGLQPSFKSYCDDPANKGHGVTLTRPEKCNDDDGDHDIFKCTPAQCM